MKYYSLHTSVECGFVESTTAAGSYFVSTNGTDWTAGTNAKCPYYVAQAATYPKAKYHFFEYKGALFAIGRNDGETASRLYLNGDQGMCETTNTTTSVIKTHSGQKAWAEDEAIGCIFKLVSGPGSNQPQPWRTITDNDASAAGPPITSSFTVSPAFDVAPTDATQYAIVASEDWMEIVDADGTVLATYS